MQDWTDLIMMAGEVDYRQILSTHWSWLLPSDMEPVMCTVFGDWFLSDGNGTIHHLDLLEGCVNRVADMRGDFEHLLNDQNQIDTWFLPGFVSSLKAHGVMRSPGQCYGYKIHPILGGPIESANLVLMDFHAWQQICSQLHEQLRKLPPGTRLLGCNVMNDKLTLIIK
jgi:hypothetical protein